MCAAKRSTPGTVAVIGAGWAGCAAAVDLARRGARVTLFDAARIPGGRARALTVDGHTLDNGQHILLGAYRQTLALMRQVGVDTGAALLRLPLQMRYPQASDGMDFVAPRLPAPWHMLVALLRAKGLARADKLALARFTTAVRWMGWKLDQDVSVAVLLERFEQTARLQRLMWHPLCLAALNTAPQQASANVFLAVLRDSLGARRAASDMLLPRIDLGRLFPEAAAAFVKARGGVLALGQRIDTLAAHGHQWHVQPAGAAPALFDAVVLAVPPPQAASLLAPFEEATALAATLAAFTYEPITTCYLGYAPTLRLPLPLLALCDDPARQHFGQFVFDRGQLDPAQAGVLAVVVSAAGGAAALDQSMLAARLAQQLAQAFPALAAQLGTPLWQRVITDKRATFACTPDLARPPNLTALPGLVLAGDYTAGEYPATLESAVRSGLAAAAAICTGSASSSKKARLSHGAGTGKAPALS